MRAILVRQFGGPEVLELAETPDPQPSAGQVLVKIHAIGVNPVDTYIRNGTHAQSPKVLPYTPGADAAGTIEAVGSAVEELQPGDRVYLGGSLTGTYAEYALCENWQVHPLPAQISFEQGAAINVPYATAYRALFQRAQGQAGETVLVHGATGGVGIAAVQLARAAGFTVIGTGGSQRGLEMVLEQGAHFAVNHRESDYQQHLMELTKDRGFDIILEMLANVNLGKDLTMLTTKGRVVVIGSRGTVELDPRAAMTRDAAILGMTLFNISRTEMASIHAALVAGLALGALRPIVGRQFPLSAAAEAHKAVLEAGAFGKIVLLP